MKSDFHRPMIQMILVSILNIRRELAPGARRQRAKLFEVRKPSNTDPRILMASQRVSVMIDGVTAVLFLRGNSAAMS